MQRPLWLSLAFLPLCAALCLRAQVPQPAGPQNPTTADAQPLPDPRTLLLDVERNDKRLEALRKDYTYHVHLDAQQLRKDGSVKKAEVTDSESLTIDGVRVDRVVARDGRPLTPEEQAKENEKIDREVAKALDKQAKAARAGEETDDRGDTVMSVARILELGKFSNERRVEISGRPTIVLDYAGDPNAKTHSQVEGIMRDLVGVVWIDEADRVLVRGEGHFLNDFKIGGGLIANVHKGTRFQFETTRVADGVWLPASIDGQGSFRVLLFAGFDGRMNLRTSDYRRFRTSAKIVANGGKVDANGNPAPDAAQDTPPPEAAKPAQQPQP